MVTRIGRCRIKTRHLADNASYRRDQLAPLKISSPNCVYANAAWSTSFFLKSHSRHFLVALWREKEAESSWCGYREAIADNPSKAGFSWGCSSEIDSTGRALYTTDAYAKDGCRFIVLADEKLTAFLELEAVVHARAQSKAKNTMGQLWEIRSL
jgi:hypothetical protein